MLSLPLFLLLCKGLYFSLLPPCAVSCFLLLVHVCTCLFSVRILNSFICSKLQTLSFFFFAYADACFFADPQQFLLFQSVRQLLDFSSSSVNVLVYGPNSQRPQLQSYSHSLLLILLCTYFTLIYTVSCNLHFQTVFYTLFMHSFGLWSDHVLRIHYCNAASNSFSLLLLYFVYFLCVLFFLFVHRLAYALILKKRIFWQPHILQWKCVHDPIVVDAKTIATRSLTFLHHTTVFPKQKQNPYIHYQIHNRSKVITIFKTEAE